MQKVLQALSIRSLVLSLATLLFVLPANAGGVTTLSFQKNEETTVCGIGVGTPGYQRSGPLYLLNKLDADTFFECLEKWTQQTTNPIACVLFWSKQTCEDEIKIALLNKNNPHFYQPFMEQLLCFAAKSNYVYKNVQFIQPADSIESPFAKQWHQIFSFFSYHNAFAEMAALAQLPFSTVSTLEKHFQQNPQERKRFFGHKGGFKKLEEMIEKRCAEGKLRLYNVDDFVQAFSKDILELQNIVAKMPTSSLRELFETHLHHTRNSIEKIRFWLNQFSRTGKKNFLEFIFDLMKSKQSILQAQEEFMVHVWGPIDTIQWIKYVCLVIETTKQYRHIFYISDHKMIEKIDEYLQKIAFKGNRECLFNTTNSSGAEAVRVNVWGFHPTQLRNFLLQVFLPNTSPIIPKPYNGNRKYINSLTLEATDAPVLDVTETACSQCSAQVAKHELFACTRDNKAFCSPTCYSKQLAQSPENLFFSLLNSKNLLTPDQRIILQRTAALCYYHSLLLLPSVTHESNTFYTQPHAIIAERIAKITKLLESASRSPLLAAQWKQVDELMKPLGAKRTNIQAFCKTYATAKQNYLKNIIAGAGKASYKKLLEITDSPMLDEKGLIKQMQDIIAKHVRTELKLHDDTSIASLARWYHELVKMIMQRLDQKGPISFTNALVVPDVTDTRDINALLADLGETQKQDSTSSLPYEYVSSEESSSEEDEDTNLQPPSPATVAPDTRLLPPAPGTFAPEDLKDLKLVNRKKTTRLTREIRGQFANNESYLITLFKVKNDTVLPAEHMQALAAFKQYSGMTDAFRIKAVFALAELLTSQDNALVIRDAYGFPALTAANGGIESPLLEKLNLSHLFTRAVDNHLLSYGIFETIDKLIQISIPGQITLKDGTAIVGFFQYSCIKDSWVLIHRCFARYDASIGNQNVSQTLRKALLDYLKTHSASTGIYKSIISDLEKIVTS